MSVIFPGAVIGGFTAYGVDFAGTNHLQASALTGLVDGKAGTLSFWFKEQTISGGLDYIMQGGQNARFYVFLSPTSNDLGIVGISSGGSIVLNMNTTISVTNDAWRHCLIAWDLTTAANCLIYIDGVDRTNRTTASNTNIDYASGNWRIGNAIAGGSEYNGELAEFWFDDAHIDISSSTNREKFAKNGKPVDLGADGSKPTGSAPLVYLKGPASTFTTNLGTGGAFTLTGSLADSSTKPSY